MKKRILLVQVDLRPVGGANAVAAWMLCALQDSFDVSLLSWVSPDIDRINRFYGTYIDASRIKMLHPLSFASRLLERSRLVLLKQAAVSVMCKILASRYDVVISACDEIDLSVRGIQYIHFPRYHDRRINPRIGEAEDMHDNNRWYHRYPFFIRLYSNLCNLAFGVSMTRIRRNMMLANSDWTRYRIREAHGVEAMTVYPPVPGDFPAIPWNMKKDGFVCLGRIERGKKIEQMLTILQRVRKRGFPVDFHIIGSSEKDAYNRMIAGLQADHASWVTMHPDMSRADLVSLVAGQKYGIHGMPREHFGIAVAEMLRAGNIVFVPNDGGQVEIVGNRRELLYENEEDAVKKICAVLSNPDLQQNLAAFLRERAKIFTPENFMSRIRDIVEEFPNVKGSV